MKERRTGRRLLQQPTTTEAVSAGDRRGIYTSTGINNENRFFYQLLLCSADDFNDKKVKKDDDRDDTRGLSQDMSF
jgi:hypothetical protein